MRNGFFLGFLAVMALEQGQAQHGSGYQLRNHQRADQPGSVQMKFVNSYRSSQGLQGEAMVREYLTKVASELGIKEVLDTLKLREVQESLIGMHYHFDQIVRGVEVSRAELIVSVDQTGAIYRVYNATNIKAAQAKKKKARARFDADRAFDIAWHDLGVTGGLNYKPSSRLGYVEDSQGQLRLCYIVTLDVGAPSGTWEHHIDAQTGEIIAAFDTRIENKPTSKIDFRRIGNRQAIDRKKAFADYETRQSNKAKTWKFAAADDERTADGTGIVFDPDPRTTLNRHDIQDDSAATEFEQAYFTRPLKDLTVKNGLFTLVGPWVQIKDFESPSTTPSTTGDGNWTAKRGSNAFNDAMTYFHLDQSQRYMQSLGFVGARAIQGLSIEVDSDGVNGEDNSHFIPSSNRLAFGHGCVDDNEDADVILHEYGHAIHHGINRNWSGGDTGAMGEGFGDYWAASYSVSTANGLIYNKNRVFSWDAGGEGNKCWPGRILDAVNARYDHSDTYGAHHRIDGGFISDELWSTPLFQSLLALMEKGVDRREVDQIILEAHFGLSSGVKMRTMADAIVATAQRLFPNGPHANVFVEKFMAHGIIERPQARVVASQYRLGDAGNNEALDPGETVDLAVSLQNFGNAIAQNVIATIASTVPTAVVSPNQSLIGDLTPGATVFGNNLLQLQVSPDHECGKPVSLKITPTSSTPFALLQEKTLEIPTGVPIGADASTIANAAIPDDSDTGVTSTISLMGDAEAKVSKNLKIEIEIKHTYQGDLIVKLVAPSGKEILLHNRGGSGTDNIVGVYPISLTPAESLGRLEGETLVGDWKLVVVDAAGSDTGTLVRWAISDIAGYVCD